MAQLKDLIVQGNSRFIGDVYSNATFHLTKNTYPTLDTDDVALITGPSTGQNLTIARSSIQARNNGSAYQLYLNERGGAVNIGTTTSGDLDLQGKLILNTITSTESDLPSIISASIKNTTTGKSYSSSIISAYQDHGSTPYGFNLVIGSGGNTILGSGESPANLYSTFIKNNTAENLYLISDSHIFLQANANTVGNRIGIMIHTNGSIYPQKAGGDNNGVSNLGSTSNRFKEGYFTNLIRVGTADTATSDTQYNNAYIGTDGFWYTTTATGNGYGYGLRGKGKNYANLYISTLGVANTAGITILALGNNIASTAADNSNGTLQLYSNTTKYTSIKSSLEITGNHLNYLPVYSATGTSTYYGRLVGIYKGTTSGSTGFSDVGSTSKPVYITANGVATPINYTIEKSVPSNAVFTDTNTKVNVTLATTTKAYLLGVSTTPTSTAQALTAVSDTGVYLDTTAGSLTTTGTMTVGGGYFIIKPYSSTYDTTGKDAGISFYYNHNRSGYNADTLITAKSIQATNFYGTLKGNADKATAANITSTDNAIVRYNGTTGTFANSPTTLDDTGHLWLQTTAASRYKNIYFQASGATVATTGGALQYDTGTAGKLTSNYGRFNFYQYSPKGDNTANNSGYYEVYQLPTVTAELTANHTYEILTTKNTAKTVHYYNSSATGTVHWITTNITASSTGTVWVRGRIFGSKGTNSPAFVVFAAAFVKINASDPADGTTSVTLNYWDPLGLLSSFQAAFDSNRKVYFSFKYSTRYSRIEAIVNHDTITANEIASISTTAPTVAATYAGTKVTT